MIFLGVLIIGASGVDFGFESAEPGSFFVMDDSGDPFSGLIFKEYADVARGRIFPGLSFIELVLGVCGEAEVFLSVIEADTVSVVDQKAFRGISDKTVQGNDFSSVFWRADESNGVDIFAVFLGHQLK